MLKTTGAEPSSEPVLASSDVPCSKKIPYPLRIAVLPVPVGSQARPTRGDKLKRCPDMQPAGTPFLPHCTSPFKMRGSRFACGLFGFSVRAAPLAASTSSPVVPFTVKEAAMFLSYLAGSQL